MNIPLDPHQDFLAKKEKKFLKNSFILFFILHIVAIFVLPMFLPSPPEQEITVDIDLLPSTDFSNSEPPLKPPKTMNMLPQLPKNFIVKTEQQQEKKEEVAPKSSSPTPQPVTPLPLATPPAAEKIAEHAEEKKKTEIAKNKESNLLKINEALKRLALEKLRSQQQKEEKLDTAIKMKMQNALTNIADLKNINTIKAKYQVALRVAIKRNFVLPDIHELKNANIKVKLEIKIDRKGSLMRIKIIESSTNKVFDIFATNTVKNSAPFPIPPRELIGKKIIIILTPMMTG